MTIQQQIKEARKAAGMTQKQVADLLMTSQQHVQLSETKGCSLPFLQELSDILQAKFIIEPKNKLK